MWILCSVCAPHSAPRWGVLAAQVWEMGLELLWPPGERVSGWNTSLSLFPSSNNGSFNPAGVDGASESFVHTSSTQLCPTPLHPLEGMASLLGLGSC